ncbi:MAG: hypothetical protein M1160_01285 [Candidatus Marsarchaeota archaeon]|jgi:hypothetical protein|nr:hypothetical protein [Candidatus Marsarchaeota archaeon]MCL5111500.1 hypothetical protein [Candidatus Marsarchaeota archaeon]
MTLQSKKASVNLRGRHRKVLFRNPKTGMSMEELAQRIIELNLVDEVLVDRFGDGFVAKIRFARGRMPERPETYVSKYISRDFGSIVKDIG